MAALVISGAAQEPPCCWSYVVDRATGEIFVGGAARGPARTSVVALAPTGARRTLVTFPEGQILNILPAPSGGRIGVRHRVLDYGVPKQEATFVDAGPGASA
jgi:hypothetical protein